jgi:hypothetical protein
VAEGGKKQSPDVLASRRGSDVCDSSGARKDEGGEGMAKESSGEDNLSGEEICACLRTLIVRINLLTERVRQIIERNEVVLKAYREQLKAAL